MVGEEVGEGEAEPVAARGVEGVEASAAFGARVAEEEEAQGGEQREELGGEGVVEEARDGAADDGVAQLEAEKDVVEGVGRKVVDRRRGLRVGGGVGAGGGHGGGDWLPGWVVGRSRRRSRDRFASITPGVVWLAGKWGKNLTEDPAVCRLGYLIIIIIRS